MDAQVCRKQGKTWFPKDRKCLDLNFKLRDPEGTRQRHMVQIRKLKERKISFEGILPTMPSGADYTGERAVEERMQDNHFFIYNIYESGQWKECSQKVAKEMKSLINNATRDEIKFQLKDKGIPNSYDTAFYMMYYKKTNALMKKILKENLYCD
ncbi:MAG: hypothetical protein IMZ53_08425 [Thermoplasmata archaeon]|nr:hypothetical protein [Thermoplasmata archaeon]MBE3140594.1 hypothetical protein [Thermoplasmata archaeon]